MDAVTLKYLLLGDDRLSGTFKQAGSEAEGAGKKVGGLHKSMTAVKVAGAALGAGLVGLFKVGFDETKDASAGTAQLASGIKSTHDAANVTVGGLNNLAGSIQNYSGQTDDSIVASEQLLLTFTGIRNEAGKNNDIFNQATKATADMAAKMGGDASKYAVQLGKALNDPVQGVTALTKIGVSFTDGQKKTIASMVKMGNTAGAQKVILGELHKEFGGAAKAAGDSLPGQLARGRRAFEDIAQTVVTKLLPIITALANFIITKVMPAFSAVVNFIMNHKTVFEILGALILTLVVGLKAWAIAQAALNFVMEANPIALVVIAIAALVAGLIVAYNHSETFRRILQAAFQAVRDVVMAVWHFYLKPTFAALVVAFRTVAAVATWLWQNIIAPAWAGIKGIISGAWNNVIKPVASALGTAFHAIGSALSTAWSTISSIFGWIKSGIRAVYDAVHAAVGWIATQWARMIGPLMSVYRTMVSVFSGITSMFTTTMDLISGGTYVSGTKGSGMTFGPVAAIGSTGGHGTPMHRAAGGRMLPGRPYTVAEERAEVFVPDRPGTMLPSLDGGGGPTVQIVFPPGVILGTPAEVGRAVGKALEYAGNAGARFHIKSAVV